MKTLLIAACLGMLFACGAEPPAPKTYDDLAAAYKAAHETRDTARLGALFFWGSMPQDARTRTLGRIGRNTFDGRISEIKAIDLDRPIEIKDPVTGNVFRIKKRLQVDYEKGSLGGLVQASYDVITEDGRAWIVCLRE